MKGRDFRRYKKKCTEEYQHSSAFCVTLDCYCQKLTRNTDHHSIPFCSDTFHHCELLDPSEHLKGITRCYFWVLLFSLSPWANHHLFKRHEYGMHNSGRDVNSPCHVCLTESTDSEWL